MTTITFHSAQGRLDGFVVEGHSGYAEAGADIVCAAVSAAVGLVECTVNEVLGLEASVKIREKDACIALKLLGGLGEGQRAHLPKPVGWADGLSPEPVGRISGKSYRPFGR